MLCRRVFYKNRKKSRQEVYELVLCQCHKNSQNILYKRTGCFYLTAPRFSSHSPANYTFLTSRNIGLATKWLRILPLGGIDMIRNHLVADPICSQFGQSMKRNLIGVHNLPFQFCVANITRSVYSPKKREAKLECRNQNSCSIIKVEIPYT